MYELRVYFYQNFKIVNLKKKKTSYSLLVHKYNKNTIKKIDIYRRFRPRYEKNKRKR